MDMNPHNSIKLTMHVTNNTVLKPFICSLYLDIHKFLFTKFVDTLFKVDGVNLQGIHSKLKSKAFIQAQVAHGAGA